METTSELTPGLRATQHIFIATLLLSLFFWLKAGKVIASALTLFVPHLDTVAARGTAGEVAVTCWMLVIVLEVSFLGYRHYTMRRKAV